MIVSHVRQWRIYEGNMGNRSLVFFIYYVRFNIILNICGDIIIENSTLYYIRYWILIFKHLKLKILVNAYSPYTV